MFQSWHTHIQMLCVSLWKWMLFSASCWSLLFAPIVSHLNSINLDSLGTLRRWQASSPLTGLASMSADAYWTWDRAAEWLARRIAPTAPPCCSSGMWCCQAFPGYLQHCQTREWRGRDRDDWLHFRTGFDLVRLENRPKCASMLSVQPHTHTQGQGIALFSHCTEVAILHF